MAKCLIDSLGALGIMPCRRYIKIAMRKVYFYTLGCKVNQYDTEKMRTVFHRLGFESTQDAAQADVCVVNTCSVTAESDRKCRNQIRRLHRLNPEAFLAVTGCYATGSPQELESLPEVDLVISGRQQDNLALRVLEEMGLHCPDEAVRPDTLTTFTEHTRAFVKIEDGCNQMCTYCRIPFYRGRVRSRSSEEVLEEISRLSEQGYREIVLCGIQLGAFGRDTGESLPELLQRMDALHSLSRFRLSSIEPDDVTEAIREAILSLPKSAPHLHLPLQSGDDGVLQRMRRRYTCQDYYRLVETFRERNPEFAISSDIMVGFPGEDEEAFENSIRAVRELEFSRLHLFRYSPRPGTKAATFPDRVAREVQDDRRQRLGAVAEEVVEKVRRRQLGRTLTVLLEEPGMVPGIAVGFSENYLRVQVLLSTDNEANRQNLLGHLIPVKIEDLDEEYLIGRF